MAKQKRTTVVIAHRLSTIRNADKIAVVNKGRVVEEGTYDSLVEIGPGGTFYSLAVKQAPSDDSVSAGANRRSTSMLSAEKATQLATFDAVASDVDEEKADVKGAFGKLWALRGPYDTLIVVLGLIMSAVSSTSIPLQGYAMVKLFFIFFSPNPDDIWFSSWFWAVALIVMCVVAIIAKTIEMACFGIVNAHLTKALRQKMFVHLLKQEVGYFDRESNSPGALCEFLSEKITFVQAACGEKVQVIVGSIMQLFLGIVFMFLLGDWRISLMALGTVPLIGFGMAAEIQAVSGAEKAGAAKVGAEEERGAGALVGEVITGIRTVASFNAEHRFYEDYCKRVDDMYKMGAAAAWRGGFFKGISKGIIFYCMACLQLYGAWLASEGELALEEDEDACLRLNTWQAQLRPGVGDKLFVPIFVVFFLATGLGQIAGVATDASAASAAVQQLFTRLSRGSKLDPSDEEGIKLDNVVGDIKLEAVHFAYPTRLDHRICNGYSLTISAGSVCALCGPSGSGKSTIIQLIERFYDPLSGSVMLDGVDLKSLNLKWLRTQLGLVGQEPVLFLGTVAENIGYGKEGATMAEIEEAARNANAHTFIMEDLGDKYDTEVGIRGGKLSGGQKQRVAIARALVRKPSVLLLDEATSALDNESERIVQAALDEIMAKQKRTTVVIAHRLSTIRNADHIAVVKGGQIVEEGEHDGLIALDGMYASLVQAQAGTAS